MKRFQIYTNCHDASGEYSERWFDGEHLSDITSFITLFEAMSSLHSLMTLDMSQRNVSINDSPYAESAHDITKRYQAQCKVLIDKGLFTDKWSLRTSWQFGKVEE